MERLGDDVPRGARPIVLAVLIAMLLTIGLGIGFFAFGGIFAPLSDAGAVLVAILLAPIVELLSRTHRDRGRVRAVRWVGFTSIFAIVVGSVGLIVQDVVVPDPEQTVSAALLGVQFIGWILLGIWLLGVGMVGRRGPIMRRRTAWAAILAGVASVIGIVSLTYGYLTDTFSIVFIAAFAAFAVGFVLWAAWLAGDLQPRSRR